MSDSDMLKARLGVVLEALQRIPRRFAAIRAPEDFEKTEAGRDNLDSICMVLVASGEAFKQIDRKTSGRLLRNYPEIEWEGVMGVRDVIAHGYFDVDPDQVFDICKNDIPAPIATVERMIADLR